MQAVTQVTAQARARNTEPILLKMLFFLVIFVSFPMKKPLNAALDIYLVCFESFSSYAEEKNIPIMQKKGIDFLLKTQLAL